MKYLFCYTCGQKTSKVKIEGKIRAFCDNCQKVLYNNPIPSVAIVAINKEKEILLTKRSVEPGKGQWCLPGGFIECGETAIDAVKRELFEETGVTCTDIQLINAKSVINGYWGDILILGYSVTITNSNLIAGDDAEEARFYTLDEKPDLVFPVHENLLKEYLSNAYDK